MSTTRALGIGLPQRASREAHWIPLADVMTGLMMMFLLVALVFMIKVQADQARVQSIATTYFEIKEALYSELLNEFRTDLPRWGATLGRDLTIRFSEPDVLFDTGKDVLKPRFVNILNDFFPRYVRILSGPTYRSSIEEIRIEGHTSSLWQGSTSADDSYFHNMALSQSRTRSTLEHVLGLDAVASQKDWLKARLIANGLSSSRLISNSEGREDREASQRVEFRVRTNAEAQISKMLSTVRQ